MMVYVINTSQPRQNGHHFAADVFKLIFLIKNCWNTCMIIMSTFIWDRNIFRNMWQKLGVLVSAQCYIGHMSFAGSGYADDVVIMAPSVRALQELLYISESFAIEYNALFNASKTMCMKIGNNFREPRVDVTLHGTALVWKDKVKHLGNILTHDLRDSADVTLKTGIFISQVSRLNVKFQA